MKENEIILFNNQDVKLKVSLKGETVWLTQTQIAELFDKGRSVITTKHINNIFKKELNYESNVQKMHITNSDKPVTFYSLDEIISVGYPVKSKQGIVFRHFFSIVKETLISLFFTSYPLQICPLLYLSS